MRASFVGVALLTLLGMLGVSLPSARAADDPEYMGRKKSEWLEMLKTDENARRRKLAATALSQIAIANPTTYKEIVSVLGRALNNDIGSGVRQQAALFLGQSALKVLEKDSDLDPRNVVQDLADNLRVEKEADVRKEVATALGLYGKAAKAGVQPLVKVLADSDAGVRAAAAEALGRIGADAKAGAPGLISLIKDADATVRAAAIFSLGRVEPDDAAAAAAAIRPLVKGEADPELRKAAVTSLCLLGDRSAAVVQSIAAALQDENPEVRQRTAQSMSKLGSAVKIVESELTKVIKTDADKLVRSYAVRTLSEGFGADAVNLIPMLIERLKADADPEVRIVIAEELGGIAGSVELKKEQSDQLMSALRLAQRDASLKVREAATEALKRVQKGPAKPKPE
jgi:HEAT repeat protein